MKKYYYFDEVNDDFANLGIKTEKIDPEFDYLPKSKIYKLGKKLVHIFLIPIVCIIEFFILLGCTKNKKVLKQIPKKSGYFIYGNHTTILSDAFSNHAIAFPKETYIITHPDSMSIKGIKTLVKLLGALPLPNSYKNYTQLIKSVDKLAKEGKVLAIYPEAHIWPHYNKIRNFKSTSFNFPIRTNLPSFAKTTVYKKTIFNLTRPVIYLDGPFYPNPNVDSKTAQMQLRDEIYNAMVKRVEEHQSVLDRRYQYIKVNTPEEVRIEEY